MSSLGVRSSRSLGWTFAAVSAVVFALTARTDADDYTSGFYTHGAETAAYLDTGDPVFDPFYMPVRRLAVVPRVTLEATRDDNLFMNAGDETSAGTVVNLAPGLLAIRGRPSDDHLYADYGSIIRVYDSSERLQDKPSHLLTFGGVYRTARSDLEGRAGYRRLENVDTVEGARILKQDYILNLALDWRLSAKTSAGLLTNLERHNFDASRYTDYDRYYGAARVYYDVSRRSQIFAQGGLGRDNLDTGATDFGDADFRDVSAGVRGKPTPKTSATGRAGYMWRTYDDERIDDIEHWIASLYGDVSPFGVSTFWSELGADIRPVISSAGAATIDRRLSVGVRRRLLSERLRGQGSVFAGRVDYRGLIAAPVEGMEDITASPQQRNDEYWGFLVGADWWTRHHLSCGLTYSYIENDAYSGASSELKRAHAYEAGRWTLRCSWNY